MLSKTNIYNENWVDMVFTDRNQEYGAYVLRKKSSRYTSIAVLLSIAIFGLAISAPVIINYIKGFVPQDVEEVKITEVNTLDEPPPIDEKEPPPETPPPPPLKQTIQYVVPVIVEEVEEEDPAPIQEEVKDETVSTQTTEGTDDGIDPSLLEDPGDGVVGGNTDEPLLFAEQMPEFPGGDEALRKFLYKNLSYPILAQENEIQGKVMVGFVVEKDGSITAVEVLGKNKLGWGLEEEAMRVVKILPKFTPGKQNGNPARVRFKLPIVFRLSK